MPASVLFGATTRIFELWNRSFDLLDASQRGLFSARDSFHLCAEFLFALLLHLYLRQGELIGLALLDMQSFELYDPLEQVLLLQAERLNFLFGGLLNFE